MVDRASISETRLRELIFGHPSSTPDDLGPLDYLIHPPSSVFSPTSAYLRFRDQTLMPMMVERPDDPNLPKFLAVIEAILVWREAVPPNERLWRAD